MEYILDNGPRLFCIVVFIQYQVAERNRNKFLKTKHEYYELTTNFALRL